MPTTRNIFEGTLDDLQRWNRREPITAAKLNQPVDALNRMGATLPRSEQVFGPGLPPTPTVAVDQSVIFFNGFPQDSRFQTILDAISVNAIDIPTVPITVALPWLLRRTPFDGQQRGLFRYVYSTFAWRWSTRVLNPSDVETQQITPAYMRGDILRLVKALEPFVFVDGEPLLFEVVQDRHWARRP